jgi:acyl carrier protein
MPVEPIATLKTTLSSVLGIPASSIGDETSVDSVAAWDSLKHLSLVLALEERFGISFTEEQTLEIVSYPLVKTVLNEHGIEFSE